MSTSRAPAARIEIGERLTVHLLSRDQRRVANESQGRAGPIVHDRRLRYGYKIVEKSQRVLEGQSALMYRESAALDVPTNCKGAVEWRIRRGTTSRRTSCARRPLTTNVRSPPCRRIWRPLTATIGARMRRPS